MAARVSASPWTEDLLRLLMEQMICPRRFFFHPGADGLTLDDMRGSYLDAAANGRLPGLAELSAVRPELAAELADFFAAPNRTASRVPPGAQHPRG
jgi:hypothetical protein